MTKEQIEELIEDAVMKGKMLPGIYDTGLCLVVVDIGGEHGDDISFRWFDHVLDIDDYIPC